MRIAVLSNGAKLSEVACEESGAYIGARADCAVRLPDENLAPQVALLFAEGDEWVLQPLAAGAELKLNGVYVAEKIALKSGDQISIGGFVIRTHIEAPPRPKAHTVSVASMQRFVQFQLPQGTIAKRGDEPLTVPAEFAGRLGRVNVSLSQTETPEQLMNIALQVVLELFGAHRAWIGIRRVNYGPMEYVEGRLVTGQSADLPEIGENLKPRVLDRAQFVFIPHVSTEQPWGALVGPLLGNDGPLGMIYLDTADGSRRFDVSELDPFVFVLGLLGAQLDAIFRSIAKVRASTLEGEVVVAHAIQARLTPRKLPQWEQLQFGAFREPGRERTTDVYDIVRMANQHAAIMIARTGASGPLPGMLMAQTQAAFRASLMHNDGPHVFLRMLNVLMFDGQADRPVDVFACQLDPESGGIRYSLAGDIGAYVVGLRGIERRLGEQPPPPAIATGKSAAYPLLTEKLEPSETLVLYTKGVVTARNRRGEAFGEARFINILCDGFGQLASAMLKEMLSDLQHFTEGGQQPDDITVILAHRV